MREESEVIRLLAEIIKSARARSGMTIGAVAERLNRDDKTISNWEKGKTAPTVTDLIRCFEAMNQPLLRPVLSMMFPGSFQGLTAENSCDDVRDALVAYLSEVATDTEVRGLAFLIFGEHGSNWQAQLQEFVALDHLPMGGRLQAAQGIYDNYIVAESVGALTATDHILPDLDILRDGIAQGRRAALDGRSGYTTASVK